MLRPLIRAEESSTNIIPPGYRSTRQRTIASDDLTAVSKAPEGWISPRPDGHPLGHFDLELVFFKGGAVELGDDSLGVFSGNIDEKMAFTEVDASDGGRRKASAAQYGGDNVIGCDAHGFPDIHVQA